MKQMPLVNMTTSVANDASADVWRGDAAAAAAGNDSADGGIHVDAVRIGLVDGVAADEELEADEEEEEEEFEVEEALDDEPMHVAGRVFLGSVDAANNAPALRRARIGRVLSLLGAGDERLAVHTDDADVLRTTLLLEDALDEDLLAKLPAILDTLRRVIDDAERRDQNVLVHCIAGRSRSSAVVVAWLVAQDPHAQSVQDAADSIRVVRPWIEMNARFVQDLLRFHAVLTADATSASSTPADVDWSARDLPRLDFDAALVGNILSGKKLVTMRLESDVTDDRNSDLARIFPFSVVAATTSRELDGQEGSDAARSRRRFALLRVDQVETRSLRATDASTMAKSGFQTADEVLCVLRRFYPDVSMETPLQMLHFQCLATL